MVNEGFAYTALLAVISVGSAIMLYGMYLSAGQALNVPAIVGGVIMLAGFGAMVAVTASALDQESHTYGLD